MVNEISAKGCDTPSVCLTVLLSVCGFILSSCSKQLEPFEPTVCVSFSVSSNSLVMSLLKDFAEVNGLVSSGYDGPGIVDFDQSNSQGLNLSRISFYENYRPGVSVLVHVEFVSGPDVRALNQELIAVLESAKDNLSEYEPCADSDEIFPPVIWRSQ